MLSRMGIILDIQAATRSHTVGIFMPTWREPCSQTTRGGWNRSDS